MFLSFFHGHRLGEMEEMGKTLFKNILHLFHSQSRGVVFISRLIVPLEPTNDQRLLIWNCENWYPNWNHTIYGGTLDFFLCWKCSNLLFRNRCEQSWRGGIWNTRGKLRARSHFLASFFFVIILTLKNILQAVFLFEVVFYITETMMNSFSTAVALVVVAV